MDGFVNVCKHIYTFSLEAVPAHLLDTVEAWMGVTYVLNILLVWGSRSVAAIPYKEFLI